MNNFLQTGDVIEIQKGMNIYASIPEKFISNSKPLSQKISKKQIEVGQILRTRFNLEANEKEITKRVQEIFNLRLGTSADETLIRELIQKTLESYEGEETFNTSIFEGEYIVVNTKLDGGGTGHGRFDIYPNGHHVFVKKLKDGKYDEDGVEISFYQSGCFTAMITDISPVRKMKMHFS